MPSFRIPPPESQYQAEERTIFTSYSAESPLLHPWFCLAAVALYALAGLSYLLPWSFALAPWVRESLPLVPLLGATGALLRAGRHQDLTLTSERLLVRVRGAGWAILDLPRADLALYRITGPSSAGAWEVELTHKRGRAFRFQVSHSVAASLGLHLAVWGSTPPPFQDALRARCGHAPPR